MPASTAARMQAFVREALGAEIEALAVEDFACDRIQTTAAAAALASSCMHASAAGWRSDAASVGGAGGRARARSRRALATALSLPEGSR